MTAEAILRALVKAALRNTGMSQAEAARQLGLSNKHVNQMITGRAPLTLSWAEDLLNLCGERLTLDTTPAYAAVAAREESSP